MKAEGYGIGYEWWNGPGAIYQIHSHAKDQSHWVISGEIEFEVGGVATVRLGAGDRDFVPAGTKYSAKVLRDQPVVYLVGSKQ